MYGAAPYAAAMFASGGLDMTEPPAPVYAAAERLATGPIAVGNQEEIRIYFANRELTIAEEQHFFDPDRPAEQCLPDGVGVDPPDVFLEYAMPGREPDTITAVKDASGEYHVILEIPMYSKGVWSYRGRGVDEGAPIATTAERAFTAVRSF